MVSRHFVCHLADLCFKVAILQNSPEQIPLSETLLQEGDLLAEEMQEFPVLYDKRRATKIITVHGRCDWKQIRIGKNNKEERHFYKTVKEQVGHKNVLFSLKRNLSIALASKNLS